MRRPLHTLDATTLVLLVGSVFTRSELRSVLGDQAHGSTSPADLVRQSIALLQHDHRLQQTIENRLRLALGDPCPHARPIAALCAPLRLAAASRDPRLVVRLLWHIAQRPGLAWRQFEVRTRETLMVLAMEAAQERSSTHSTAVDPPATPASRAVASMSAGSGSDRLQLTWRAGGQVELRPVPPLQLSEDLDGLQGSALGLQTPEPSSDGRAAESTHTFWDLAAK